MKKSVASIVGTDVLGGPFASGLNKCPFKLCASGGSKPPPYDEICVSTVGADSISAGLRYIFNLLSHNTRLDKIFSSKPLISQAVIIT